MAEADTEAGAAEGAAAGADEPRAMALDAEERDLIRSLIVANPELVLGDDQVMRALIAETGGETTGQNGRKVVDLRDRLVERLEMRLKRLVQANRSVIAAAYENVAGTRSLHRAVLALIAEPGLQGFLRCLTWEVPIILGVEEARLCLEADVETAQPADSLVEGLGGRVLALPEGTVDAYMMLDGSPAGAEVALRPASAEAELVFGPAARIASEALLVLDLDGAPALLAFGSADAERFEPDQGTELLHFFARAVERLLLERLAAEDVASMPADGG